MGDPEKFLGLPDDAAASFPLDVLKCEELGPIVTEMDAETLMKRVVESRGKGADAKAAGLLQDHSDLLRQSYDR